MTNRFFSLIAVLAISLLTACAQVSSHATCKSCPAWVDDCCGACPCGVQVVESTAGKMCDPATKKKHHRKHSVKTEVKAETKSETKGTIPLKVEPAKKSEAAKTKATPKAEPEPKKVDVLEGVKKIIKDVSPKDPKDLKKPQ